MVRTRNHGGHGRGWIQRRPVRRRKYALAVVVASGAVILATAWSSVARQPTVGHAAPGLGSITEASAIRSTADRSSLSSNDKAVLRTQRRLDAAADRIRSVVRQRELAGYGNLTVSPRTGQLFLYWKGPVPAELNHLIGSLDTRTAITIKVRPAAYTSQQLSAAADTIARSPAARSAGVVTVKTLPDASGIEVDVNKHQAIAAAVRAALPSTGVAVQIVPGSAAVPIAGLRHRAALVPGKTSGRSNDRPPFWGGSRIRNPSSGTVCTSGWPVHYTSNPSVELLMTANHCGSLAPGGDQYFASGTNVLIGRQIGQNDLEHDTSLIELDGFGTLAAQAKIYVGALNTMGNYPDGIIQSSNVTGSGTPNVGDLVCVDGGYSGESCDIEIINTDVLTTAGYFHMVQAEAVDHTLGVAGDGDSGGPVYITNPDNGTLTALGTLSAIGKTATSAPCTGIQNRKCSWRVYFSNINDAIQFYGISVLTSP